MSVHTPGNGLDLAGLSIEQLRELRTHLDARIRTAEAERRRQGFAAVEEVARRYGITKADLAARYGGKRRRKRRLYRNPEDPSQSWAGRGRRPAWIETHLKRGGALEELAV